MKELEALVAGRGALDGLKVIDVSRVLAGPYAGQMLGDHGAEVIKLEPPAGDGTRMWGAVDEDGISPYYAGLNRNKEHLSVDLSTDAGRGILLALLADADVLIENFLPGTMNAWGLGEEWLLECFPRLVYCRISAFGVTGPMAGLPGYDAVIQAHAGLMHLNGEHGGGPVRIPVPITDLTTGMLALSGILLALLERTNSGRGQIVDVSLLDAAVSLLHPTAANYFATGSPPERIGSQHPNIAPCDVFVGPGGGHVYVSAGTDEQFRKLCEYLGVPDMATEKRFATNRDRLRNRSELTAELRALIGASTVVEDAAQAMIAAGIPASTVRPVEDVLADEQVVGRNMTPHVGDYRVLGVPIKLSRTAGTVRTPPRAQGKDNRAILRRLGYDDEVIDALHASNIAVRRDEVSHQAEQPRTTAAGK